MSMATETWENKPSNERRTERKESVLEFVNTEASYGEDLRIIKEEFYLPMQAAGLLSQEQLLGVFSNIQELIDLNENFLEILQEEIDRAFDQVQMLVFSVGLD
uniref:DH domain-containing protein n=1 Tax=Nothoprocta perdicaria TaxID=30464 RepID=A0A8C6ZTQ8_NOTPE